MTYWIFRHKQRVPSSGDLPDVTVVVCAHRNVKQLERLITCLRQQTYQRYSVVLVNDGPDPEIGTFLRSLAWEKLEVIEFDAGLKAFPGKKAPLAAGILAARGDVILLTDADCEPGPEWVSTMVAALQDNDAILGFAPFFRRAGLLNALQRLDAVTIAVQYFGAALRGRAYMGVGRNLMYKKDLFSQTGGFQSHAHVISGDDDLFIQSTPAGTRVGICTDPRTFVYSEAEPSAQGWLRQKRRHISAGYHYQAGAILRTMLFGLSWIIAWLCLPVLILQAGTFLPALIGMLVLWGAFALQASAMGQRDLTGRFPLLAILYSFVLLTFAALLMMKQPTTWRSS